MRFFEFIVLKTIVVFSFSIEQPVLAISLKEQLSKAPNFDGLITENCGNVLINVIFIIKHKNIKNVCTLSIIKHLLESGNKEFCPKNLGH